MGHTQGTLLITQHLDPTKTCQLLVALRLILIDILQKNHQTIESHQLTLSATPLRQITIIRTKHWHYTWDSEKNILEHSPNFFHLHVVETKESSLFLQPFLRALSPTIGVLKASTNTGIMVLLPVEYINLSAASHVFTLANMSQIVTTYTP